VTAWKRWAIKGLTGVFADKTRAREDNEADVNEVHARIGGVPVKRVTRRTRNPSLASDARFLPCALYQEPSYADNMTVLGFTAL